MLSTSKGLLVRSRYRLIRIGSSRKDWSL